MEMPLRPHPDAVGHLIVALGRYHQIYGITARALQALEATPKPWPNSVKRARLALAQSLGMQKDAIHALPAEVRTESFRAYQDQMAQRKSGRKDAQLE